MQSSKTRGCELFYLTILPCFKCFTSNPLSASMFIYFINAYVSNLDYKVLNGGVIVNSTIRSCRRSISGSLFEVVFQSLSGQIETIRYKPVQMANFRSHFKQSTCITRSKIGLGERKRSNKI